MSKSKLKLDYLILKKKVEQAHESLILLGEFMSKNPLNEFLAQQYGIVQFKMGVLSSQRTKLYNAIYGHESIKKNSVGYVRPQLRVVGQ